MPRPPEAMPVNVTNKLSYCASCNPKVPFGFGGIMQIHRHRDAQGVEHTLTVIGVAADEKIEAGEPFQAFLARMMQKYVP